MMKYTISARKLEVDSDLESYIERKLAKLDRYFARAHRPISVRVELHRDEVATPDKRYVASARIEVQGPDLFAETATINPHSAIDILEAKLKEQIRKYKSKHSVHRFKMRRQHESKDTRLGLNQ